MQIKIYSEFDHLPIQYAQCFDIGNVENFFFSIPWFENLVGNALDDTDKLRIYGVESSDAPGIPIAMLPMRYRSHASRRISPLTLHGLANYYTPLFGPVLNRSHSNCASIIKDLVHAICADDPTWDCVDLHPLAPDAASFTELLSSFREAGWIVQPYFCFGNWYLRLNGHSYNEYFKRLPSALRSTVTRKRKKIEDSGRVRMQVVTRPEGIESAILAYQTVYAASWKKPEPYADFMPGLIRTCAQKGSLRLGLAFYGERPIAAQLWIVNEGSASIYKLAYDEQFCQYSIGSILTAHLMEYVIEGDQVREVDYLVGDDAYKQNWMSDRRERWGLIAFNSRKLWGMLGAVRQIGGRALKRSLGKMLASFGCDTVPTQTSV